MFAPVGPLERVRDDVLAHPVDERRDLGVAAGRRPERGPDLPRPPAQQERVGGLDLGHVVGVVLLALDAQGPRVAPALVLVEAGRFDHAVQGHERRHDQLHATSLEAARSGRAAPSIAHRWGMPGPARAVSDAFVPVPGGRLFVRALGTGPTVIAVHGGPDFDHEYFRPELDVLASAARLVYYDQRGRGRSFTGELPEVTIASEVADLDAVREAVGADRVVVARPLLGRPHRPRVRVGASRPGVGPRPDEPGTGVVRRAADAAGRARATEDGRGVGAA